MATTDAGIRSNEEIFGRRISLLSCSIGAALAVTKIVVGMKAASNAVVSDGLETSGDVLSSLIVYIGLLLAGKPPDAEHPYGHGRYETLAGLAVGGIILLTGAGILWHGFNVTGLKEPLRSFALYPLVAAAGAKIALAAIKLRVGKKIESSGLQADAWHDMTDLLSTVVAFCAVTLTLIDPIRFGFADRLGSIVISVIVIFLAIQVVHRTVDSLLDTMPEDARMAEIRAVALSVPGTLGIEKCFARRTGLKYHVDLHLEVDPQMTVEASHDIATQVKIAVKDRLAWVADVLIHVEPASLGEADRTTAAGSITGSIRRSPSR
ncbi:MAG TPA: cation diffusion facilitator family transporter [Bryobacteraceae bacterium]|jgi:cation diffusion facilitator family transporter|nr:cation diffusion facilitator family transporter [Bryobacteraceae bacterium]